MSAVKSLTLQRLRTDGGAVEFAELGTGSPLLFLAPMFVGPSVATSTTAGRDLIDALASHHRLVTHGLRGEVAPLQPRTEPAPLAPEDTIAVLDSLEIASTFVLANYFSAPWAISLAARYPARVRGLVLWNGVRSVPALQQHPRYRGLRAMGKVDPEGAARAFVASTSGLTATEPQLIEERKSALRGVLDRPANLFDQFDATEEAASVECPTLIVIARGTDLPPREIAEELPVAMPHASVRYVDSSAANLKFSAQLTVEVLREFIADQVDAPSLPDAVPTDLTPREREVLSLISDGRSNKQIAAALGIRPRTAGRHVENILGKTGAANRTALASLAIRHNLI